MVRLEVVRTDNDVRLALVRFSRLAPKWDYASKLARMTTYWVHDPTNGQFAPSKFAGYRGIDAVGYDAALAGDFDGAHFDGHVSRRAIEAALGSNFEEDEGLIEKLLSWAEGLLGVGVFDGIDHTKAKFVVLSHDSTKSIGVPYRPADERGDSEQRKPFDVDPDKVDRGTQAHRRVQNALAAFLRRFDIEPRSPGPGEPEFDLAWVRGGTLYVAEVKSVTSANEEKQLRLGLGQVLRYRHLLGDDGKRVRAVLAAEVGPSDPSWVRMCQELGVLLTWPGAFDRAVE